MKKKILIIIISVLVVLFFGILSYFNIIFSSNIPILAYHDVLDNPLNDTDISYEKFEKQMEFLKKHNYRTLSLDEFYEWKNGKKIPGKKVVLTFDDGYESFYTKVVPILNKYNFKATVFVVESNIGNNNCLTKEEIDKLKENENIAIESHSNNLHLEDKARSNDYDVYNDDLKNNNGYKYYAYPFGINNDNYVKALKDNNYKMAFLFSKSTWANKKQDDFLIPRVPIYNSNSLLKFKLKVLVKI